MENKGRSNNNNAWYSNNNTIVVEREMIWFLGPLITKYFRNDIL